jgi:hypothetical protein
MKNKILTVASYISAALFLGFLIAYLYAEIADPLSNILTHPESCPHISFGNVKITVEKQGLGGCVIFFNQEIPNGRTTFGWVDKEINWDDYGIYFRLVKVPALTDSWWTLMISFWYPIIIFSILPLLFLIQKWHIARKSNLAKK